MIFTGNIQDPTTLVIPGLVQPVTPQNPRIMWGDDINFSTPYPGGACSLRLIIKEFPDEGSALISKEVEVEADENEPDVEFFIIGPESREKLKPGIYHYQVLKTVIEDDETRYSTSQRGTFEIIEGAASREIPASES